MITTPPAEPSTVTDHLARGTGLDRVAMEIEEGGAKGPPTRRLEPAALLPYLLAGTAYLALSLVVWWHVLAHLSTVTTCGCGDTALTLWVVKWPAYALSHGLNPLYSSKMLVPQGINMVPNSLALGLLTAPLTWLSGPVASLNVIDVISPPLSALAMFWLLSRWVRWAPACFAGGLFFGFSPFAMVSLALGHPNFGLLAPVPLIIGCLDELFVRRRHPPALTGVTLGLLTVVEFFVSVEVLLLAVLFSLFAALLVGLWATVTRPPGAGDALRRATVGMAVAAGTAGALLAYPLWFFFKGPAHLAGRAWPDSPAGTVATTPGDFVDGFIGRPLTGIMHLFGGYQGPRLPLLSFLGTGVLVVVVAGVVIWWRDHRLVLFGLLGLIGAALSLGVVNGQLSPWRLFTHVAVLDNVVPVNISAIIDTCVAVMVAVTMGHARSAAQNLGQRRAALVGAAVAALALVPVAVAVWPNLPMTVRPVTVPRWFAAAGPGLTGHQVVLPYPASLGGIQSSLWWQASDDLAFAMVGGGGPGVSPSRAGVERPGFDLLARASLPLGPAPLPSPSNLTAIRSALSHWGVTTVVVPDQPDLPTYDRGRSIPYAVGLFTAVIGRAPTSRAGAWVWTDAADLAAAIPMTQEAFVACTTASPAVPSGSTVAACVQRAGTASTGSGPSTPTPPRPVPQQPAGGSPALRRSVAPVQ